jgi:hypothetical protein
MVFFLLLVINLNYLVQHLKGVKTIIIRLNIRILIGKKLEKEKNE